MIYTVTFNPAIDYAMGVTSLSLGGTNRSQYESILPGGKGLNVSTVLTNLGIENTALGFIAGFTGDELERLFTAGGGRSEFIRLESGMTRINVKLKGDKETEINANGPIIDTNSLNKLFGRLSLLGEGDTLVLAGSIPPSLPRSLYADIMKRVGGARVVVDAELELLTDTLEYRPFLVKPNNHELGAIFGVEINTRGDAVEYAKKLQAMGARNVLVSMAGEGAVLAAENGECFESAAPEGTVVNSVGAGDSMVAGFIAGHHTSHDYETSFKMGIAAGSASAFSEKLASAEEIKSVYDRIK